MFDWGRRADALVQFSVPSFEYPRTDTPGNLHYIGPLSSTVSAAPLPDWWSDLDGSRPVIHVTQGTVANTDYDQVIAPALRALADDDVLIVVATGGRPLDTLPPLPANARAATYLPYDELLPRTAVYVTNGGYGGVQCALRYGVPIVTTGGKEDKPEVGARVAWSGVGRRIRSRTAIPTGAAQRHSRCAQTAALPRRQPAHRRRYHLRPRLCRIGRHCRPAGRRRSHQSEPQEIRWPSTPKKCRCPGSGCSRTRLPFSGGLRPSARATTY